MAVMSSPVPASLAADFAARGVRDVECLFPDVSGYPRGKLMPATAFAGGAELRIAQAIPMQCVTGDYSLFQAARGSCSAKKPMDRW